MAKYLVTGGGGFIGTYLVKRLEKFGHDIVLLDNFSQGLRRDENRQVRIIEGDIRNKSLVNQCMAEVDGCFHLAGVPPSAYGENMLKEEPHSVNFLGSINVFNAAKEWRVPVVYASSASVYGNNVDFPLRENSTTQPITCYGVDKLACEHYAKMISITHRVPILSLRLFNVFGKFDACNRGHEDVVSLFASCLQNDKELLVYSDGQQTRDFLFIEDAITLLIAAMDNIHFSPMVLNACTGKGTSINELAKILAFVIGATPRIRYLAPKHDEIFTSYGDTHKSLENLGYLAEANLCKNLVRLNLQGELVPR